MSLTLNSQPITPIDEEFVAAAHQFAQEKIAPNASDWEKNHVQPQAVVREAISEFTKYYIPKELGGLGASCMSISRELEELAGADYGFTFGYEVHNHATMVMAGSTNTDTRDKYLPKLMSGEMIGAFLLTEPNAGSDAAHITTKAVEKDGKWVINGEKAWITNAASADLLLVFAQAGERARDIMGFFIKRNTPGVELVAPYDMIGAHAMGTGSFRFNDVVVGPEQIAYQKGEGFKAALGGIDFARFAVASMCNGGCINCLDVAIEYAKNRIQFNAPIIANQAISFKLADAVSRLEASRMLTFQAARMLDEGKGNTAMMSHAKKFATCTAYENANVAMQCMGSIGLNRKEYPLVRQTSAMAIAYNTDGTNDICNLVISKSL